MERVLSDPGFADDDGSVDPRLRTALGSYEAGDPVPLATLLPAARVLVPLVAVADGVDERGVEKNTDMAVVTLQLTDGQKALPVFTSVAALTDWHPHARPLPIVAARAAEAALAEDADLLVLDPGGPVAVPIDGPALRTLAAGRPPLPVLHDPDVADALRSHLQAQPAVRAAVLLPAGDGVDSDAVLALVLREDDGQAAIADLSAGLASDPVLAGRLHRGLDLAVLPPGTHLPTDRLL